jgi:hypothetical protein
LDLKVGRRFVPAAASVGGAVPFYLLVKPAGSQVSQASGESRRYISAWTPVHLDFVVADVDAAVERARSRRSTIVTTAPWGRIAHLADPAKAASASCSFSAAATTSCIGLGIGEHAVHSQVFCYCSHAVDEVEVPMDVEGEIRDLKHQGASWKSGFGPTQQVRAVHRDLLNFQTLTTGRFDAVDGRFDRVDGRLDSSRAPGSGRDGSTATARRAADRRQ